MLTQDPIGLAGGVNLYAYAGNNPIAYSDPFGLCPPRDQDPHDCTQEQRDTWEKGHITFADGTSWKGVDKRLHTAVVNTSILLNKKLYVSSTNNSSDRHASNSLHYASRAVDISRVDGQRIANDKSLAAPVQNTMLDELGGDVAELFGPDWLYKSNGMTKTEAILGEHQNHVHVGVKGPLQEE